MISWKKIYLTPFHLLFLQLLQPQPQLKQPQPQPQPQPLLPQLPQPQPQQPLLLQLPQPQPLQQLFQRQLLAPLQLLQQRLFLQLARKKK